MPRRWLYSALAVLQGPHGRDVRAALIGNWDSARGPEMISAILEKRGYANGDIDAIFHNNWLNFFRRTLPS